MPDSFYFPVYSGILTPEHNKKMGPAIWAFLWCISKTTKEITIENEQIGLVLGGKSIKYSMISEDIGVSEKTVSRYMGDLVKHGYIKTIQSKYGVIIHVRKSKKFISKMDKNVLSEESKTDNNVHSQLFKTDNIVHYGESKTDKNVLSKPFKTDKNVHPYIDIKNKDINKDLDIKNNTSLLESDNGLPLPDKNEIESCGVPSTDLAVGEIQLSRHESDGVPSTVMKEVSLSRQDDFKTIESHYICLRGSGIMTAPDDDALIFGLLDDNIPLKTILDGIDKSFANYKPKYPTDKIRKFSYCDAVIRDLHYRNTKRLEVIENKGKVGVNGYKQRFPNRKSNENEDVPQHIIEQLEQQKNDSISKHDKSKNHDLDKGIEEMLMALGEMKKQI